MKLYINHNLEICANEKGWPEKPGISAAHIYEDQCEAYDKALAKAKKESVRVEMGGRVLKMPLVPGTFIELDIEVEFVKQYKLAGSGLWVDSLFWTNEKSPYNETRTFARIKPASSAHGYSEGAELPSAPFPQNPQVSAVEGPWSVGEEEKVLSSFTEVSAVPEKQRCEYELAVEKYFGLVNWPVEEPIEEGSDYTHLVNLLAMFDQEKNEQLRAQLADAEKRVKQYKELCAMAGLDIELLGNL